MKKILLFLGALLLSSGLVFGQKYLLDFPIDNSKVTIGNCFGAGSLDGQGCFAVIANPDKSGINLDDSVGMYIEPTEGEPWMGWYFDLNSSVTFSGDSALICAQIWVPVSDSTGFTFKLENPGNAFTHEFPAIPTIPTGEWIQVCQDITGSPADGQEITRISIFFNITEVPMSQIIYGFDNIIQEGGTSIDKFNFSNSLKLYPNPASQEIRFTSDGLQHTIQIFDMAGRLVKQVNNTRDDFVNILDFESGLYMITVIDLDGKKGRSGKFIKK